jgi:hypothetical protein
VVAALATRREDDVEQDAKPARHGSNGAGTPFLAFLSRCCNVGRRTVKNLFVGFVLGVLCAYFYLVESTSLRSAVDDWWARASAPSPSHRRAPR